MTTKEKIEYLAKAVMTLGELGDNKTACVLNEIRLEMKSQLELPEGLEEAARHSEILTYPMPEDGDIEKVMKVQEARIFHEIGFKAGAEWGINQCPIPEDTTIFLKGVAEGKRLMLEEAVEGYVNYYEDSGGILMAEAQVGCPYHNGDKVKIIVIKEEQK